MSPTDSFIQSLIQATDSPPAEFHGGRLREAVTDTGIPLGDWLDLSTGINPQGWTAPPLEPAAFSRLPENRADLLKAATQYYFGAGKPPEGTALVATPGSQWFIQHFPALARKAGHQRPLSVLVPDIGYREHRFWWQAHGHVTEHYSEAELTDLLNKTLHADVMVIINPNNPSARKVAREDILTSARRNADTLYVVDEAFMDTRPADSLLAGPLPVNLVVLRSLGKFFGLAGLRVGFCLCDQRIGERLHNTLGPWPLATASEYLATQALLDQPWQEHARKNLQRWSADLNGRLEDFFHCRTGWHVLNIRCTDFFVTVTFSTATQAASLHSALKRKAVLTRLIKDSALLRFGLPAAADVETFMTRLRAAADNN